MIEFFFATVLFFTSSSAAAAVSTTNLPPVIPTTNITLPPGTTNHGNPNLLCKPATIFTVLTFIFTNYLAHAATTAVFPGERTIEQVLAYATSFLYPAAGVGRGINSILRGLMVVATRGESELHQAAAAGALCMVIRTKKWRPTETKVHGVMGSQLSGDIDPTADIVYSWRVKGPPSTDNPSLPDEIMYRTRGFFESKRIIHGANRELPSGYVYTLVPPTAIIKPTLDPPSPISIDSPVPSIEIAQSRSFIKVLVAVFQLIYSSWTLYEARGDQIDRFGYAAFSLTVAPYVVMSFINLVGGLLLPTYPALFLVRSDVMDEVEHLHDGRHFDGVVGTLQQVLDDDPLILTTEQVTKENMIVLSSTPHRFEPDLTIPACAHFEERDIHLGRLTMANRNSSLADLSYLCGILGVVFGFIVPLCIILGLSHFHKGRSSVTERVWFMLWYTLGGIVGLLFQWLHQMPYSRRADSDLIKFDGDHWLYEDLNEMLGLILKLGRVPSRLLMLTPYSVLGIGSMVVVGQMIKGYGDCQRF